MSSFDYWKKKKKRIEHATNWLSNEDYTKELRDVYERHLEIIEEILDDLAPESEDDQYTETTSWNYEDELKQLEKRTEELEAFVEEKDKEKAHQKLLKEMEMTQEQYDVYIEEQREIHKNKYSRNKKIKKK